MIRALLAALAALMLAGPALAGSACEARAPSLASLRMAERTATATREVLERTDADVFLLGRVGSDVSEYGLRFTHIGMTFRMHPQGPWLTRHMLNHCGRDTADLFDQGLMMFYLDTPFAYDTLVLVPDERLQADLQRLAFGEAAVRVYEPRYSMLAYPFLDRYQNSNQWLLELTVSGRVEGVPTRAAAQQVLKATGYRPTKISLSPFKRLGASLFKANVRFDDHPAEEHRSNRFSVVTVRSIADYLQQTGQLQDRFVIPAPETAL